MRWLYAGPSHAPGRHRSPNAWRHPGVGNNLDTLFVITPDCFMYSKLIHLHETCR